MTTIILSQHAKEAVAERCLDEAWIMETVAQPHYREPDPRHADRWRLFRWIGERGKVLRVVCTRKEGAILVITAHLDRSKRYEDLLRP